MNRAVVTQKTLEAMAPDTRVHFLNENAVRVCKCLSAHVGLEKLGVQHVEIEPGKTSTEFHFHHNEEECIYMLTGTLELRLGSELHTLNAGDFVGHIAGGEPHLMRNISAENATYLLFGQRLEKDTVDYPDLNKRLVINGDATKLVDLNDSDT
ncbi:MAG: cupin domain-containing protein [Pseudomonadota bacterium]